MAVMGPSYTEEDKQLAEAIYLDVLEYLRAKYDLLTDCEMDRIFPKMAEARDKEKRRLRKTIRNIVKFDVIDKF